MEARSLLIVAALFMLLNGAVLGLLHRSLSPDVRPSAVSWRIGTLLMAGGSLLISVQDMLPPWFIFPVSNGALLAGLALYWRAVRKLQGLPAHRLSWVPAILAVAALYWFAAVTPDYGWRVVFASLAWAFYLFASAYTLYRTPKSAILPGIETGRHVLLVTFVVIGAFLSFRAGYYLVNPSPQGALLNVDFWLTLVTLLMVASLPVVGTTAFLVICSERLRRQWEHAAATDYLTGLPNRRSIIATGEARFAAARRTGGNFAVAVIDIDHFKSVNDRFGHEVGDLALKHLAGLLELHVRGPHMVGRQGGEEFVAVLEDASLEAAKAVAERLRTAVEATHMQYGETALPMTISIGIGVIAPADRAFDVVLQRADHALYTAKTAGRNRVEMAPPPAIPG